MNERVIWQGGEHHYTIKGTLADWTNGIAALAGEHQIPRFMVAAAFAGPLLVPGNCESGLFHFHGFSSRGKTISLRAAASVWGDPHDGKYVRNWRTTANALETTLAMCCDTFLPIDETGQANPKDIQTVAYEIAGGAGKARMSRDATAKPTLTWRVLAGSTGEKPIAEILREKDAVAAAAGQLVRAVDVAVPENALGEAGRRTAEKIEAAAYENHGTAGRAFVRRIIDGGLNHGGEIRRRVDAFVGDAEGQEGRVKERFALVAAAGELANEFGIVRWGQGAVEDDARALFEQWLAARRGPGAAEPGQIVAHVRRQLEQHGDSRFDDITPVPVDRDGNPLRYEPRPVVNRIGYRKDTGQDRRWMVLPEVWRAEFCAGHDPAKVAEILAARNMLEKGDGNHLAKKVRVEDRSIRAYVLTPAIFEA